MTAQRERFESTHPVKLKVRHCSDLVLLSLFVYPPPSRGLKVRTLEIVRDRSTLDAKEFCDRNFLIVNKDGSGLRLQINRYKTKRFRGRDEVTIQASYTNDCASLTKPRLLTFQLLYPSLVSQRQIDRTAYQVQTILLPLIWNSLLVKGHWRSPSCFGLRNLTITKHEMWE